MVDKPNRSGVRGTMNQAVVEVNKKGPAKRMDCGYYTSTGRDFLIATTQSVVMERSGCGGESESWSHHVHRQVKLPPLLAPS